LEEEMLEVDCSILTPHDVLKTSGHVDRFADLMCKDQQTGEIYRVDHLVEAELERRLKENTTTVSKDSKANLLSPQLCQVYESILAQVPSNWYDQKSQRR